MTNIQAADLLKGLEQCLDDYCELNDEGKTAFHMAIAALESFGISEQLPSAQPEIIRCHQCGFWDRETLRHQFNDFRDWNEAECLILAERDAYDEINRYTEADDYCSYAERRIDG